MDYARLIRQTGRLFWQHKFIWLFGALAGLPALVSSTLQIVLLHRYFSAVADGSLTRQLLRTLETGSGYVWVAAGLLLSVVAGAFTWVLVTVVDAAIIEATVRLQKGERPTFPTSWRRGQSYLTRLIGVDTLLLLPLFGLTLVMLLLTGGGMAILAVSAGRAVSGPLIVGGVAVVLLGNALLLALAAFTSVVTILVRTLAFRSAIVEDLHVKASVRRTAGIARQRWKAVLFLSFLQFGFGRLFGMLIGAIVLVPRVFWLQRILDLLARSAPVSMHSRALPVWLLPLELMTNIAAIAGAAVLAVLIKIGWTLAYMELAAGTGRLVQVEAK